MKKIFLIFSLMVFYACGGGGSTTPDDDTPPSYNITAGPDDPTTETLTSTFEFTTDADFIWCRVDSGIWNESCTSPDSYDGLSVGMHVWELKVLDLAGNEAGESRGWTVSADVTPPETTITSGPGGASGSTVGPAPYTAFLQFESDEANSTFQCNFNAEGWVPCASVMSYPNLPDGSYLFEVKATDAVGNEDISPDVYTWTVMSIL